jgi:CheY-like chemotaxis protein
MRKIILIVSSEAGVQEMAGSALQGNGYEIRSAHNGECALAILAQTEIDLLLLDLALPGMSAWETLMQARKLRPDLRAIALTGQESPDAAVAALRYRVCDLLHKPSSAAELREAVCTAISSPHACSTIEVLSAKSDWLELLIPCDLETVQPLYRIFTQLEPGLSVETREAIAVAFRELLQNAIEHGGQCDPAKQVMVSYVRMQQLILCGIKDPGNGFKPEELGHAAVSNPSDDPYRHLAVRDERGLRPGGFGLFLAHQLVDEIIYNDRRNEVMIVKYL